MKDELAAEIIKQLTRSADAHEGMLAIAAEARVERLKLAEQMKERFKAGFNADGKV